MSDTSGIGTPAVCLHRYGDESDKELNRYLKNMKDKEGEMTEKQSAFNKQVGGNHYKSYVIQPYEFFFKNNVPHHKAAIIRRIMRYDHETGKGLEDLLKIKHEVDLIIELEGYDAKNQG